MRQSNISLIIRREYLATVGKKSFIVMTVLIPILFILLCCVLPAVLAGVKSDDQKAVAVVDATGQYAPLLTDTKEYVFLPIQPSPEVSLHEYYNTLSSSDDANGGHAPFYALVTIPQDIRSTASLTIYSEQTVARSLEETLSEAIEPAIRRSRAAAYGIDSLEQIMAACDAQLSVRSVKWAADGSEQLSSTMFSQIVGILLATLIYMFVMIYGAMVMNSVMEEKTNRIVEVIVSSCRPMQLMLGKIIGVALVGLTQIAIWCVMVGACVALLGLGVSGMSAPPDALMAGGEMGETILATEAAAPSGHIGEALQMIQSVNWAQLIVCFLLYFVGGYLLYAALFAAFASAVDQPNDSSQFMMPVVMILVFALYAGMYSMDNPDGPLARWCSHIPFTSPIVMLIRLPYDVPVWELLVSFALLFATALGITFLAGRIYRTGILMYGKKFSVKEILHWIRQ